jgi:hypothetical protein
MPGDLLSEAQALGDQLAPAEATPMPSADLEMIAPTYEPGPPPPPAPTDEPDPDASEPYAIDPGVVANNIAAAMPDLGADGAAAAATAFAALPRDVVALLDQEGMTGPASIALVAEIGANIGGDGGVMAGEVDVDAVARHATAVGLEVSLEQASYVCTLLNSLPPKVRSGITESMAADPEIWGFAAYLGRELGSFELRRPLKGAK